ncbi:acyl-CoA synthetase [Duganella aceris]|uniref:Long-chain fatty acid--CoA ligase n=1 Tax=Duganella aceris TaxID=2703883 RepID=A0ABX0FKU1_9BURK|nr:long-chain fatty acid--CoA ligase [Duganella aceris]NGZ85145.1 long-chain fatty acid--CoA ligase [Duganella aceris]
MYITQVLHRNLQQFPERPMTIHGERQQTVDQFVDRVARLAGALRLLGVEEGDRVAMLALNSDRYLEYLFAVPWAGAVLNPCNTRWSAKENAYALADSGSKILIVDDSFKAMAPALRAEAPSITHLVYAGDGEPPAGMLSYEALLAAAPPLADARRGGDQLFGIFYTGGTTGFPKGVMLSHSAFWSSQIALMAGEVGEPGEVMLRAAPMFHLADMAFGYAATLLGATHVIVPAFHPVAVIEAIARHGVMATLLVPTMIQMLVQHPDASRAKLGSLRYLAYGGSPIQEQVLSDLLTMLPGLRLTQAYGQTEMSPVVTILGPEQHGREGAAAGLLRSCGRAGMAVEVRVLDAGGDPVAPGCVGEIVARGPNMMSGYWNKPDETRLALSADGWLHTGDAGCMDENGYLFIVDRVKDMIVSGGENVFSAEVENALAKHPDVAMCAVIGIPDARWGEMVHAVVVARPGRAPTPQQLIAHCRELIAGYKCPKSVELREALPLSGAGKVLKTSLREPFWRNEGRRVR